MISPKSLLLFVLAGSFEIGGGYLIWKWIKENHSWQYGIFGFFMLAAYGIIATFQTSTFAKSMRVMEEYLFCFRSSGRLYLITICRTNSI